MTTKRNKGKSKPFKKFRRACAAGVRDYLKAVSRDEILSSSSKRTEKILSRPETRAPNDNERGNSHEKCQTRKKEVDQKEEGGPFSLFTEGKYHTEGRTKEDLRTRLARDGGGG